MKRVVWVLLLFVALVPCGFAHVPGDYDLPQLGQAGAAAISQAELDEIGDDILAQLRRHNLILQDPLVTDYIRDVGHRIASHSDSPGTNVHYYVMATPELNSFALPGGNIFIFTGLLLETDNENELAGVIAHETVHVTQHHIARQVADSEGTGWKSLAGLLAGLILAAETGQPEVAMAATMGTQAALLQHRTNFTRHQEYEADRIGIGFMARAGYDPDGMAQLFQKFEMLSRGELKPPAFLLDHPLDQVRITEASQRARQLPDISHPNSRSYLLMRARARVLVADHPAEALAYFNGIDTSKLSTTARNAIDYGRALCLIRMHRADEALALLDPLLSQHPDVVAYYLGVASAQLKRDQFGDALATLSHAASVFPDSLAVKIDHAQALMAADRPADAKNVMEAAAITNPHDPVVLQLLAQAASAAGNTGEGRYYLSQVYQMNGQLVSAINQMQIALNNPHINDYEQARYRARLDDLKDARMAQKKNARSHLHFGVRRGPALPYPPMTPFERRMQRLDLDFQD
ncbi:MAG TPA: M48 family metalloprotease [Gammaproteobacteria bacterium]|nr:M48 family metalloprotease [Gammaproteobacteria bacterium]